MSVSLVAHNAYDNCNFYNTLAISLSFNTWNNNMSITNVVNTWLVNLNTSVKDINSCVQNISRNYWFFECFINTN